ncbi:PIG-L deacetylase family protein [Streptomyces sp. NPDC006134]|uniref:PIG-L deacetylase family protein n=1 Tax=Streptomyces sp. NPDC006134 TaxID=3154467 RepID=UPI0033EC940B
MKRDKDGAEAGAPDVPAGSPSPQQDGEDLRDISVLVADRDPGVTAHIAAQLRERGAHPVGQAVDEAEFLQALRSRPDAWHVALWHEGLEPDPVLRQGLLQTWQREFPATATVLTTDTLNASSALLALRGGAVDIVRRHASGDELASVVRRACDTHRTRRAPAGHTEAPRLLVVGAHPDDCEIGAGGIIHRRVRDGWQVSMLAMSHGSWGGEPGQRAHEAQEAAASLGAASFHLEDFPDGHITDETETVQAIERVVHEVDPDVVLVHSVRDTHQDHRAVHRATLVAARRVPRVGCYQSPSATADFTPNRFIGLREEDVEAKLAAIARHASQATTRPYLDVGLIRATARYWGRFTNDKFAEPLEIMRYTAEIERSLV